MPHEKHHYEERAKTIYGELRDIEKYIYDDNYGGGHVSNAVKVRLNLLLSDMRRYHLSLLELISVI